MQSAKSWLRLTALGVLLAGCGASEGDVPTDCTDGKDNDGDGFIDCLDGGCATSASCNPLTPPVPDGDGTGAGTGAGTGGGTGGGTGSGTGTGTGTTGGSGTTGTPYAADLAFQSLQVTPTQIYSYGVITLDYVVVNNGMSYSVGCTAEFRWSVDGQFQPTDLLLCSDTVPAVPPGGISYGQVICNAPGGGYYPGNYAIVAALDSTQVVPESNEANNTSATPILLY